MSRDAVIAVLPMLRRIVEMVDSGEVSLGRAGNVPCYTFHLTPGAVQSVRDCVVAAGRTPAPRPSVTNEALREAVRFVWEARESDNWAWARIERAFRLLAIIDGSNGRQMEPDEPRDCAGMAEPERGER